MKIKISDKAIRYYFFIFWFFTLIGSSLYIHNTALSIRNILFPGLLLLLFSLRSSTLNYRQQIIFAPLGLLFLYAASSLVFIGISIEILKDFFYFSFIPVLYLLIMKMANKYGASFFRNAKNFGYFLIYFLFAVVVFELLTDIHFPVHTPNRFHIPSAFFTNANDLSVIVTQLLMLVTVLHNKEENRWKYTLAFLLSGFIVFITMSRISFFSFILVSTTIFLLKGFRKQTVLINIVLIALTIVYLNTDLPNPKNTVTIVERSKIRTNSMTSVDFEEFGSLEESLNDSLNLNDTGESIPSSKIRMDIYKIPLRHPDKFITGHGFNSDPEVITKYRTLPYRIVNSHSLFIQMIFYFGWIGFSLFILFFGSTFYFALTNIKEDAYFIVIILVQALLLNVPSSSMRFPLLWLPYFLVIAWYLSDRNKKKLV